VTAVVRGDLANNHIGATYEFVRTGTTWAQKAKFTGPDRRSGPRHDQPTGWRAAPAEIWKDNHHD